MTKNWLIVALSCLTLTGFAQSTFHAYSNTVDQLEGGPVEILEVIAGQEHFNFRVPRGFTSSVDEDEQKIVFNEKSGAVVITVQATQFSPGTLPDDDDLQSRALAANPDGHFLQLGSAGTHYKPAKFVDSFRMINDHVSIKRRHAFVPCPDGLVEFVLSANTEDFERGRLILGLMLGSFSMPGEKPASP